MVEIGCGTGLDFPLLEAAVGRVGRIIGVDLTDAMLHEAKERVRRTGWTNVELVQRDPTPRGSLAGGGGHSANMGQRRARLRGEEPPWAPP